MKFDHIGVVVEDLSRGRDHFRDLFGIARWTTAFRDDLNEVWVQFGERDGICYELIAPLGATSPVARSLDERTRILNHVAYLVEDLDAVAGHLKTLRCAPASKPKAAIAYGGARIQFFVSPMNFIVEMIEGQGHVHRYE